MHKARQMVNCLTPSSVLPTGNRNTIQNVGDLQETNLKEDFNSHCFSFFFFEPPEMMLGNHLLSGELKTATTTR